MCTARAKCKLFVPVLSGIAAANGLVWLLGHWSIRIRVFFRFYICPDLHDASHCQVGIPVIRAIIACDMHVTVSKLRHEMTGESASTFAL